MRKKEQPPHFNIPGRDLLNMVPNDAVSDTTGAAMKTQPLVNKKIINLRSCLS